jgi:hypothetical protein
MISPINKKGEGEANIEKVGKYLIWIVLAVICGIAIYILLNKLTTI